MNISVICSTYNKPRYLEYVMDSLNQQSLILFELLIADDGSSSETKKLINKYQQISKYSIQHIWHKDFNRRKSLIHNIALKKAKGDLIIFIDGDCILDKNFILDHWNIFVKEKENYLFMGRRVELGEKLSLKLLINNYKNLLFGAFAFNLFFSCLRGDSQKYFRKFSIKNLFLRKMIKADNVDDLLGCNFSLNKKSMIQVNGFNVDHEKKYQWGEDGDLFIRLKNTNHKLIGKKYYCVMYHIWHKKSRHEKVDNAYLKKLRDLQYTYCRNGLDQL